MVQLFGYVDVTDTGFIVAVLSIAFNPLFWNVVRTAFVPAAPLLSAFLSQLPLEGKTSFEKSAGLGRGNCAQLDLRGGWAGSCAAAPGAVTEEVKVGSSTG